MNLEEIRQKYPQYNHLSDAELKGKLHQKFYSDMPKEDFDRKLNARPGYLSPRTPAEGGGMHPMESAARTLGEGASFGYSGELIALAEEALGRGEYSELLKKREAEYEEIPASARGMGELVGGTATALAAPLAIPGKVAQVAGAVTSRLPGWLKASGLSGAYGALYGSGTAEEGERLEGALDAGETGMLLGAAGYPIVKGVQWVGGKIGEGIRTRRQDPGKAAMTTLRNRVALDELNKAKMEQRLTDLGEGATLFDVGRSNVQGLGRHVASVPGPARNRAGALLDSRARAESSRVNDAINKGLSPTEYYEAKDAFLESMKTQASPLYEKAYKAHRAVTSRRLRTILDSDQGKKAVKEAVKQHKIDQATGDAAPDIANLDLDDVIASGRIPLRVWNVVKTGFDDLLKKKAYNNPVTGGRTTLGRKTEGMKKRILRELDAQTGGKTGDYAKARRIWGGEAESLEALEEGSKAINMDPDLIARRLAKLSDAGKEAYRTGFARALKKSVGDVRGKGSPANRIFSSNWQRKRIRAVFPNNEDYRTFRKALVAQQRFAQGRTGATTGSMTEPRRAESMDILEEAGGVGGVFAGTALAKQTGGNQLMLAGLGRRALRKTADALIGPVKTHDLEAAKLIFNRDPAANKAAIDAIFEKRIWDSLPAATKKTIGRALMVGAGQQGAAASSAAQEYLE